MFIYQGFESEEMISGAAFFFKTDLVIINYLFVFKYDLSRLLRRRQRSFSKALPTQIPR